MGFTVSEGVEVGVLNSSIISPVIVLPSKHATSTISSLFGFATIPLRKEISVSGNKTIFGMFNLI